MVEGGRRAGVLRAGCGRWLRGKGMARCLLPIPLSLRHSCVCLYEDLSNSTLDPFPTSPFHPRGAFAILPCHYHPVPLSPQAFSTSGRRGPRVMIVFVHPLHGGGGEGRRSRSRCLSSFLFPISDASDASLRNASRCSERKMGREEGSVTLTKKKRFGFAIQLRASFNSTAFFHLGSRSFREKQ